MPVKLFQKLHGAMPENPFQHTDGLRAVFYRWISTASPAIAEVMHDVSKPMPFNIGPLVKLSDGCGFEINVLNHDIFRLFIQGYAACSPGFVLGGDEYSYDGPVELLREVSYEQLLHIQPSKSWDLRMVTPTAHHTSPGGTRIVVPVPDARNYFGSWLNRWNLYSLHPFDDQKLLEFVAQHVGVQYMSGKTSIVVMEKDRFVVGFTGDVSFCAVGCSDRDTGLLSQLTSLVEYSQYCHTGVDTLRGLGMTIRI